MPRKMKEINESVPNEVEQNNVEKVAEPKKTVKRARKPKTVEETKIDDKPVEVLKTSKAKDTKTEEKPTEVLETIKSKEPKVKEPKVIDKPIEATESTKTKEDKIEEPTENLETSKDNKTKTEDKPVEVLETPKSKETKKEEKPVEVLETPKSKETKVKETKTKEPKAKEPKAKEPKVKEPKVKETKVKEVKETEVKDNKEEKNSEDLSKSRKPKKPRKAKTEKVKEPIEEQLSLPLGIKEVVVENNEEEKEEKPVENIELKDAPISVKTGLNYEQVKDRMANHKVNVTTEKNTKSIKKIIIENILTPFNILNILVAVWLITIGDITNLTFMLIITANIVIGIVQEIRAKKTIDGLSLISAPSVSVLRNGKREVIKPEEIVLDDIMILDAGKQICSDCVIRKGSVEVNESLLTGEADAVFKKKNGQLYSGSFVVSGECYASVEHVGDENYIQKLTSEAKTQNGTKSDILKTLNFLAKIIIIIVLIMGPLLFLTKYFLNDIPRDYQKYVLTVKSTCSGIVGMIPSGLFLITSLSLAVGVLKLAKSNTLVNDLYSIEMLARVNTLCLDKTGTITDGSMRVKDVVEYNNPFDLTVKQMIANINASLKDTNATSIALEKKFGKAKKSSASKTIPFSSQRKYSACYFKDIDATLLLGAPEFILGKRYDQISKTVESYAKLGYRVIILAQSKKAITSQEDEFKDAEVVAMIAIEDTIRKDAIKTIDYFKKSGVAIKVISGDNPLTVSKVAKRAGVEDADKYISLDGLTDAEVEAAAIKYTVFGRVTPAQKKLLVKTLKENDNCVAMTGDGVNDILALKEADCSIAMANGSEAARSVSNLVLLDSNFSSLPKVVSEGRRVINNIQRGAALYLTKTIFSVLITTIVLLIGFVNPSIEYPIQPKQLMLYDFIITGLPSLYLAVEPNNAQIKGKFLPSVISRAAPGGLLIVLNYLLILSFSNFMSFGATPEEINITISTLTVITTTGIGFIILYHILKPFSMPRVVAYVCDCLILIFLLAVGQIILSDVGGIRGFLSITKLGFVYYIMLGFLFLLSTYLYKAFTYLFSLMIKEKKKPLTLEEFQLNK